MSPIVPQCFRLLTPSHGSTSNLRQKRSFIPFCLHADVSYFLCCAPKKVAFGGIARDHT